MYNNDSQPYTRRFTILQNKNSEHRTYFPLTLGSHAGCTDALKHGHHNRQQNSRMKTRRSEQIPSLNGGSLWSDGPSSFMTSSSICIGY